LVIPDLRTSATEARLAEAKVRIVNMIKLFILKMLITYNYNLITA
jgi:hypothetical protein